MQNLARNPDNTMVSGDLLIGQLGVMLAKLPDDRAAKAALAIGNEFVRQALAAFDRVGMLREFWTTISWNPSAPINRLFPRSVRELFGRRSFPESVRSRTQTVPFREK